MAFLHGHPPKEVMQPGCPSYSFSSIANGWAANGWGWGVPASLFLTCWNLISRFFGPTRNEQQPKSSVKEQEGCRRCIEKQEGRDEKRLVGKTGRGRGHYSLHSPYHQQQLASFSSKQHTVDPASILLLTWLKSSGIQSFPTIIRINPSFRPVIYSPLFIL